jgi:hypothetical protein
MKNQELQKLAEGIIAIVAEAGIENSVMVDAQYRKYRVDETPRQSYLVSIFHSTNAIHQYQKNTAAEALQEAKKFADTYANGGFDTVVNTYKESLIS